MHQFFTWTDIPSEKSWLINKSNGWINNFAINHRWQSVFLLVNTFSIRWKTNNQIRIDLDLYFVFTENTSSILLNSWRFFKFTCSVEFRANRCLALIELKIWFRFLTLLNVKCQEKRNFHVKQTDGCSKVNPDKLPWLSVRQ